MTKLAPLTKGGRSQVWGTPDHLYDRANQRWGPFTLDAAASVDNAKCDNFLSEEDDALDPNVRWSGRVWLNPPYADIEPWIAKAQQEVEDDVAEVVV